MRNQHYKRISKNLPPRSLFDLSYEKLMTADLGRLYPIMCDEVVPGDFVSISAEAVIRFMPMVAPILHEVNAYIHYYFVPYRLLWNSKTEDYLGDTPGSSWEKFITGDAEGDDASSIPVWTPTDPSGTDLESLWDYFGFPAVSGGGLDVTGAEPIDFPRRAYNLIFANYYLDQNFSYNGTIGEDDWLESNWDNEAVKPRFQTKDYFTSALPWQQRGTSPSLPVTISGTDNIATSAVWDGSQFYTGVDGDDNYIVADETNAGRDRIEFHNATQRSNVLNAFNDNTVSDTVDFSNATATSVDINDLRLSFQIQKWLERNARSGVRYTEFIKTHFGNVAPRDERLDRAEYIGGLKCPVIVSEVLQTSTSEDSGGAAGTPQGNLAGHGIGVASEFCGKINVQEFGLIMGIMSIMPKLHYASQGINRQWNRETRYDFYFPEFANLSEQAIYNKEIFVTDGNSTLNNTIFGYQGRYNEMRSKENQVCGLMRDDFDYWHLAQIYGSVPTLGATFIQFDGTKRYLAATDEPACMVKVGNIIKAWRPLPIMPDPGFVDH